ncbi:MAG: radical SAM protein, partial [Chryseobacterium sp.]
MPVRDYTYYDYTISLCPECLKRVGAKIIIENDAVFMTKRCPDHGFFKTKIATDVH